MTTAPVMSITDEQIAEIEADGCYPTADEFRALISRLRAAEKDAERYRFIRNYDDGDEVERALINPNYTPIQIRMGAGLDKSIDAAMEQSK